MNAMGPVIPQMLMPNDTINVTIAGHLITWTATRTVTLFGADGDLLDQIVEFHQVGALLPVLPKPRPLSWCERLRLRFVLWEKRPGV